MKKINIQPLEDRLVVKRVEAEQKTAGGIVLPDSALEKPQRGDIVAVGSGRLLDDGTRVKMDVKVGDTVLFGKYAGTEIKFDTEEYVILRESDLLGKIVK